MNHKFARKDINFIIFICLIIVVVLSFEKGAGAENYLVTISKAKTQPFVLALGGTPAKPHQQFLKTFEMKMLGGGVTKHTKYCI